MGRDPPYLEEAVLRRNVWYFHGFDPATTKRYFRIFAAASERLGVKVREFEDGRDGWLAGRVGQDPPYPVETRFHYLRYEDLVRTFQRGGFLSRIGRGLRTLLVRFFSAKG